MKIKILSLLLVLTLLLTACGGQNDTDTNDDRKEPAATSNEGGELQEQTQSDAPVKSVGAVKLTEKGTVSSDDFSAYNRNFMVLYTDDGVQLVDLDGKTQSDTIYADVNALISGGLCIVEAEPVDGAPQLGVANAFTGEELVPCEAVSALLLNDRYLLLAYKTGVTEDSSESLGLYTEAETYKSIYFTGYAKVLDLEEGRFVPGIEVTTSMYDVAAVGPTIFVETDYSTCVAYDSDGNELGTYEYMNPAPDSGLILQGLGSSVPVFDGELNKLSELEGSIYSYDTIDGMNDTLIYTDTTTGEVIYRLIDLEGNALSADFYRITDVYEGKYILSYEKVDDNYLYGIADYEGNEIIPYAYKSITYVEPGYFCARNDDGYFMFDTQGNQINNEALGGTLSSLCVYGGTYDELLVLSTGELLAVESYPETLCLSLVCADDTIYELISGEKLFENVDDCFACGDSIYVRLEDEDCYTRYIAEFA